jgi:hypothetical protein
MARALVDTTASVTPLIAAVDGKKPYIIGYELQGVTGDNTVKFENADDNSDLVTVQTSTSGGGAYWQEQAETKGGKDGVAINLTLSGAERVVGSVEYVYR